MKTLLILSLYILTTPLYSQKIVQTFKWETVLVDGSLYVGIAETRDRALEQIETIIEEMGSAENHIIDYQIRYSPLEQEGEDSIYKEFRKSISKGKPYVHITTDDVEVLKREKYFGRLQALYYYRNIHAISEKKAEKKFIQELLPLQKFLFLEKNNEAKKITLTMLNADKGAK